MISTGTDVKPIECVFFMRNVKSAGYFEQMKGRGVRVISPDKLKAVTPSAKSKELFFIIVDAVEVSANKLRPALALSTGNRPLGYRSYWNMSHRAAPTPMPSPRWLDASPACNANSLRRNSQSWRRGLAGW